MSDQTSEEPTEHHGNFLACCHLLAMRFGEEVAAPFASITPASGPEGRKLNLERVMQTARSLGLQTIIQRPALNQIPSLPVIAELRDGRYVILADIQLGSTNTVTLQIPQSEDHPGTNRSRSNGSSRPGPVAYSFSSRSTPHWSASQLLHGNTK